MKKKFLDRQVTKKYSEASIFLPYSEKITLKKKLRQVAAKNEFGAKKAIIPLHYKLNGRFLNKIERGALTLKTTLASVTDLEVMFMFKFGHNNLL